MPQASVDRFNRWQGLAIGQLSVAVALYSALSIAGLGTGLSLLQNKDFVAALQYKATFASSFVLFFICALTSCAAVVTRTLDFRLTARVARQRSNPQYAKPLTILCLGPEGYGRLTWFFFWVATLSLIGAGAALAVAGGTVYVPVLFGKSAA